MSANQDTGVTVRRVARAAGLEYDCARCKDWGTDEQLQLCPAGCEASQKFARIRAAAGRQDAS